MGFGLIHNTTSTSKSLLYIYMVLNAFKEYN